jgi:hypothetical protein
MFSAHSSLFKTVCKDLEAIPAMKNSSLWTIVSTDGGGSKDFQLYGNVLDDGEHGKTVVLVSESPDNTVEIRNDYNGNGLIIRDAIDWRQNFLYDIQEAVRTNCPFLI